MFRRNVYATGRLYASHIASSSLPMSLAGVQHRRPAIPVVQRPYCAPMSKEKYIWNQIQRLQRIQRSEQIPTKQKRRIGQDLVQLKWDLAKEKAARGPDEHEERRQSTERRRRPKEKHRVRGTGAKQQMRSSMRDVSEAQVDPALLEYIRVNRLCSDANVRGKARAGGSEDEMSEILAKMFNADKNNSKVAVCSTVKQLLWQMRPVERKATDKGESGRWRPEAEIAVWGRSNVGKSSLLRALLPGHLWKATSISNVPGHTRSLYFISVRSEGGARQRQPSKSLTLVDMPGYGFAFALAKKQEQWMQVADAYLKKGDVAAEEADHDGDSSVGVAKGRVDRLKRVLLLIDARQGIKQTDRECMDMLDEARRKYQVVLTKVDLVKAEQLAKRCAIIKAELHQLHHKYAMDRILLVSSKSVSGVAAIKKELGAMVH